MEMVNNNTFALFLAKLGLFFANCDGDYDDREKLFLSRFITQLRESENIEEETLAEIYNLSPDKIVADTLFEELNVFIQSVPKNEQYSFKRQILDFAHQVILADGYEHPEERKYFHQLQELLLTEIMAEDEKPE